MLNKYKKAFLNFSLAFIMKVLHGILFKLDYMNKRQQEDIRVQKIFQGTFGNEEGKNM